MKIFYFLVLMILFTFEVRSRPQIEAAINISSKTSEKPWRIDGTNETQTDIDQKLIKTNKTSKYS